MSSFGFIVRFVPTDEEIVTYFLRNKIAGNPLPVEGVTIERNMYGENATPWELFKDDDPNLPWQNVINCVNKLVTSELVLYVFTKLTRVGKKGKKQKNRTTGCGVWLGKSVAEPVLDGEGKTIGIKKSLKFQPSNKESSTTIEWIMHEYSVLDCDDYVLCKIKRIDSSAKVIAITGQKRMRSPEVDHVNGDYGLGERIRSDDVALVASTSGTMEPSFSVVTEDSVSEQKQGEVTEDSVSEPNQGELVDRAASSGEDGELNLRTDDGDGADFASYLEDILSF